MVIKGTAKVLLTGQYSITGINAEMNACEV